MKTAFIIFLLSLTIPVFCSWQYETNINYSRAKVDIDKSLSIEGNFGNKMYMKTDSGLKWSKIYIAMSSYVYGISHFGNNITAKNTADAYSPNALNGMQFGEIASSGIASVMLNANKNFGTASSRRLKNPVLQNYEPATTISFFVMITKYVKVYVHNDLGKKTVKVSNGKLTQGLYRIKVDNTNVVKSLYYYRLETDEGTVTKKWFC